MYNRVKLRLRRRKSPNVTDSDCEITYKSQRGGEEKLPDSGAARPLCFSVCPSASEITSGTEVLSSALCESQQRLHQVTRTRALTHARRTGIISRRLKTAAAADLLPKKWKIIFPSRRTEVTCQIGMQYEKWIPLFYSASVCNSRSVCDIRKAELEKRLLQQLCF